MKIGVVFSIIFFSTVIFSQTIVLPEFSELKGMEDQQGNTHLFYRIYESYENDPMYWSKNDIYHFDLLNLTDTLFLTARYHQDPTYNFNRWISDLDFWNNNPAEFIYSGGAVGGQYWEGSAYVKRFDGFEKNFGYFNGSANYVDISPGNDSTLFLGVNTEGGFGILSSSDGGRNWDSLSAEYQFLSLDPYSENIYFVENQDRQLFRTTDTGNTFNLVDPEFLVDTRFCYDSDGIHIYRKAGNKLVVSENLGEQFSWQTVYTNPTTNPFYFSNDNSEAGSIFITDRKNILHSTDYGNSFSLYSSLERKIVGIYKKPNSDILYAATKYKIYEITPDTTQVIKSLSVPEEVLNYYPLATGNKWVYDEVTVVYNPYPSVSHIILVKEVFEDTLAPNGKRYFKVNDETLWESSVLERADTSNGKVYRYFEDQSLPENEYPAYDLLAELGDTVETYRMGFNTVMFTTMYDQTTFEKWGLNKPKKVFQDYTLHPPIFSLTQDVGLDSIYFYFDFGDTWITLKGCIIDGVVYGDTAVVSVEDEKPNTPTKFSLSQNYPNPFNPTTKISWQIPVGSQQTLKVFDVLGKEVATLVDEYNPAGKYEVEFDASSLPSGVYFYTLSAGNYTETKKMMLIK